MKRLEINFGTRFEIQSADLHGPGTIIVLDTETGKQYQFMIGFTTMQNTPTELDHAILSGSFTVGQYESM